MTSIKYHREFFKGKGILYVGSMSKGLSFFGKIIRMLEEKDGVLGFEPVTKFLPSVVPHAG